MQGHGIAERLAAIGAPVCPGELGNPEAEQTMLAELSAQALKENARGIHAEWHGPLAELLAEREHADAVRRGAIHINDQRVAGTHSVLLPDLVVTHRWITIAEFRDFKRAEAFAAGYSYRRDHEGAA